MNRKLKLLAVALLPSSFISAQQDTAGAPQSSSLYEIHRERAIQMNELAGHFHSLDDSRKLAEMIAAMFADDLPPMWATNTLRDRLALAEYQSAIDPTKLIPEQRIADAWNKYVREIAAPEEALVNIAEIHNLRDAFYVETMPDIYAVNSDGKLADGCRTFEALRVIWDIANLFENLRVARERVLKGITASDLIRKSKEARPSERVQATVMASVSDSPVRGCRNAIRSRTWRIWFEPHNRRLGLRSTSAEDCGALARSQGLRIPFGRQKPSRPPAEDRNERSRPTIIG
jgi:hypothetical protein